MIKLNYINKSNDTNNSQVILYQKNMVEYHNELYVAWTVIQNSQSGSSHPFTYSFNLEVAVSDSYGNYSPQYPASPGDAFKMSKTASGDQLLADGAAASALEIDVRNGLPQGAIDAWIFRDNVKLATVTNVVPGQLASFGFNNMLWIGVTNEVVKQGSVVDASVLSEINTEISLLGIASADIVMTGGGLGPAAQPYVFTLENVVMA